MRHFKFAPEVRFGPSTSMLPAQGRRRELSVRQQGSERIAALAIFMCSPLLRLTFDPARHDGDGALIDRCGIPGLDYRKVGLAFLIALARLPAFLA